MVNKNHKPDLNSDIISYAVLPRHYIGYGDNSTLRASALAHGKL